MVPTRALILFTTLCGAVASPCLANPGDSKVSTEVKAVVVQHNKALNAHNLEGVMATYSPAPNTVLLGTGPGEAYVGGEGISGAYNQFFTKFKPEALSFKYDWISSGAKGNVAWFAMTSTMSASGNDQPQERALNLSGTLVKEKGKWRFVSMHFSRLAAEQQETAAHAK